MSPDFAPHDRLRRAVLLVLALGMLGSIVDLLLLSHFEGVTQVLPLGLLALGGAACSWAGLAPGLASARILKAVMLLLFLVGVLGVYLHFDGNREFQLEVDATQKGWPLFLKVIRAHAPPALAPASLCLFAVLGWVCAGNNRRR